LISSTLFQTILLKRFANKSIDKVVALGKRILSDDFERRLNQVISKTIKSYEEKNPIPDESGQYAFYKSEVLAEKLSEYILFDLPLDEKSIQKELENNSKVIQPTQEQLGVFFNLFYELVQADEKLEGLYIEENYKRRILEVGHRLQDIDRKLESIDTNVKRLLEKVLDADSKKWLESFLGDIKVF